MSFEAIRSNISQLYTGKDPWHGTPLAGVIRSVLNKKRPRRPLFHNAFKMENDWWNLMKRCWSQKASQRLKADQVMQGIREILIQGETKLSS